MCERTITSDGRSSVRFASSIERSKLSTDRSSPTSCTCHPYASKRRPTSSLKDMFVSPASWMWLLS
jgi:hypothetical protein